MKDFLPLMGLPALSGEAAFNENSVANLSHWYNLNSLALLFTSGSTNVANDGDPVGDWLCEIVPADNIAQATTANKPTYKATVASLNNRRALLLDGGDFLQGAFTAPMTQPTTLFFVAQLTAIGSAGRFFDGDDVTNRNSVYDGGPEWAILAGSVVKAGTADTNPHVFCAVFNGASSVLAVDGVTVVSGNAGAAVLDGLTLGARYDGALEMTGYFGEMLIIGADAPTADKNKAQNYLAAKFGIAVTKFS